MAVSIDWLVMHTLLHFSDSSEGSHPRFADPPAPVREVTGRAASGARQSGRFVQERNARSLPSGVPNLQRSPGASDVLQQTPRLGHAHGRIHDHVFLSTNHFQATKLNENIACRHAEALSGALGGEYKG